VKYNYQLEALEKLQPAGFKKQREFFFLIREPNIMVLYRKFDPKGEESFYLAFTHTFFSDIVNKDGRYLLPTFLEYYPVSISIEHLAVQYLKHKSVEAFDCDLHHLKREMFPPQTGTSNNRFSMLSFLKNIFISNKPDTDANNPVDIALNQGLRFFQEFSPAFSYRVLTECKVLNNEIINKQIAECKSFMDKPHIN
jgi:hypothetical protein